MGALERLIEKNQKAARPLLPAPRAALCLVACDDAPLTRQLEERLGLEPGDAVVVRLPGAGAGLGIEVLQKAVAKAVLLGGCEEVVLLGHSACSLAQVSVDTLIAALDRAGVPRGAVPFDLRDLVGAGHDPRAGLRAAADALRRTEFLPDALLVHLAELDDASGVIKVLEHGAQHKVTRRRSAEDVRVAGYEGGPMEFASPPSTPAPATTQPGLTRGFDVTVVMPEVTTVLRRADVTASPTEVERSTPQEIVTAAELFRDPPPGVGITPPLRPVQVTPPKGRHARGAAKPPQVRPEVVAAMEKVRGFLATELPRDVRRATAMELQRAVAAGASADELVKIALRPLLQTGQNRYQVIDELMLIKQDVLKLPSAKAGSMLEELIR